MPVWHLNRDCVTEFAYFELPTELSSCPLSELPFLTIFFNNPPNSKLPSCPRNVLGTFCCFSYSMAHFVDCSMIYSVVYSVAYSVAYSVVCFVACSVIHSVIVFNWETIFENEHCPSFWPNAGSLNRWSKVIKNKQSNLSIAVDLLTDVDSIPNSIFDLKPD